MTRRFFQFPWRSRPVIDADVDDELRFHLDARTEVLMARGLSPDQARATAAEEFGDLEGARRDLRRIDEHTEDARRRRKVMREFAFDVRYSLRALGAARPCTQAWRVWSRDRVGGRPGTQPDAHDCPL